MNDQKPWLTRVSGTFSQAPSTQRKDNATLLRRMSLNKFAAQSAPTYRESDSEDINLNVEAYVSNREAAFAEGVQPDGDVDLGTKLQSTILQFLDHEPGNFVELKLLDDELTLTADAPTIANRLREQQDDLLQRINDVLKNHPAANVQMRVRRIRVLCSLPDDTIGLALSGGGIRSASFCIGVLQSLARHGWLKKIDYLSTVSGGGYAGSFLGRFFDVTGRPDLVAQALQAPDSQPIQWLRSHSNYLAPRGNGDWNENLVQFWRNLLSILVVLGVLAFAILGLANVLTYELPNVRLNGWVNAVKEFCGVLAPVNQYVGGKFCVESPWADLGETLFWLTVLPLAIGYWVASEDQYEGILLPVLAAVFVALISLLLVTQWAGCIAIMAAVIFWIMTAWRNIRRSEGHLNPVSPLRRALSRRYITRLLSIWSLVVGSVLAIAVIDLAGRYLAQTYLSVGNDLGALISMVAGSLSLVAFLPLLRFLVSHISSSEKQEGLLSWLMQLPVLPSLVVILFGIFLPLVVLSFVAHTVFLMGDWKLGAAATLVAALISFLLGRQSLIAFVNRSGNLGIYSARLSRVFLGAVNPERHRHREGRNVGHVIEGDDVPFRKYAPHQAGGPLHLINVAVNETIDVASERGSRERQAENMAIGPAGLNVAQNYHGIWSQQKQTGRLRETPLQPLGDLTQVHPFLRKDRTAVDVEGLTLREWLSISGAAFSPGMGRNTNLGRSILFTLTNLRLGYWWNSGVWSTDRYLIHLKRGLIGFFKDFFHWAFAPQTLVISEMIGRFGGPWRRHWYLSDGGHFELTGAYELIRRRVPYVIVVDVGADQKQTGEVISWLTRLVRVDFGAEIVDVSASEKEKLLNAGVIDKQVLEQFGTIEQLLTDDFLPEKRQAALLKVTYPPCADTDDPWLQRKESWLLYIRSGLDGREPVDVRGYHRMNPDFPHESTFDQFFDDAQWESYRKLGEHIGDKLFHE